MAADDVRFQANFKTPGGTLVNVYATDAFQAKELLSLVSDLASEISSTEALLSGTGAAANGLGATPVSTETVPQQPVQQFAPPNQGPPPAFAQPQAQPAPQADSSAPVCQHGPMTFRNGANKTTGKPWSAYFCPTPKGTPGQCEPHWNR